MPTKFKDINVLTVQNNASLSLFCSDPLGAGCKEEASIPGTFSLSNLARKVIEEGWKAHAVSTSISLMVCPKCAGKERR